MAENHYDIICIGTGITGLYFGYKSILSNKRILFLEKDNRVGGRIKSASLDNSQYWAEGCATRFFIGNSSTDPLQSDNYVFNLLQDLSIDYTTVSNELIQTNTSYTKVVDQLFKLYPGLLDSYSKLSLPTVLELLGYSSKKFANNSGYQVMLEPMNLNIALRSFEKFSSDTQNIINGGYENVCQEIYNKIKNVHTFKFNEQVIKIDYDGKYIINDKYITKKILFTGTIDQLNKIMIDIDHLSDLKKKLVDKYFNYRAIRIYLKINNPWWTDKELFKR